MYMFIYKVTHVFGSQLVTSCIAVTSIIMIRKIPINQHKKQAIEKKKN